MFLLRLLTSAVSLFPQPQIASSWPYTRPEIPRNDGRKGKTSTKVLCSFELGKFLFYDTLLKGYHNLLKGYHTSIFGQMEELIIQKVLIDLRLGRDNANRYMNVFFHGFELFFVGNIWCIRHKYAGSKGYAAYLCQEPSQCAI